MSSITFMALLGLVLMALLGVVSCGYVGAPYAEWAHSHVVWINRNLQHDTELYDMVAKYQQYGIPVGGVNIDSTWSQCINNFKFDNKKFPHPQQIAPYFHSKGIKVILWTTSIVNKDCPQFQEGKSKGYFLNKGKTIHWWHGEGAFIDYFNADAKKWFQGLMDRAIDLGFDGWKCDGTDPLIYLLRPMPYSSALKRYVAYHEYANQYYGSFYNYTKSINPDTLIMARPVDSFQGKAFLGYAPKYVMFSGWVGDQQNTVDGFRHAMVNIIHSGSRGYLNFGFDIGAYKQNKPTEKWLFIRWMQVGALLPFMENGGNGKHQPWQFDNETVDTYRKFVLLHYDLKNFFLSAGTDAYARHQSVVQPLIKDKKIVELSSPDNLGYVLWNTFLVEPIFQQSGYVDVIFPKGYKWIYYFNHNLVFNGQGFSQSLGITLNEAALFMRSNSVIPIKEELWLVYLQPGVHQKIVVAGDYSDEISIVASGENIAITVQRYYKSEEIRMKRAESSVRVRLIGKSKAKFSQSNTLRIVGETEYQNELYFQVPFFKENTLRFEQQVEVTQ